MRAVGRWPCSVRSQRALCEAMREELAARRRERMMRESNQSRDAEEKGRVDRMRKSRHVRQPRPSHSVPPRPPPDERTLITDGYTTATIIINTTHHGHCGIPPSHAITTNQRNKTEEEERRHTLASCAGRLPPKVGWCSFTWSRPLACGRLESEHDTLGSAVRWSMRCWDILTGVSRDWLVGWVDPRYTKVSMYGVLEMRSRYQAGAQTESWRARQG